MVEPHEPVEARALTSAQPEQAKGRGRRGGIVIGVARSLLADRFPSSAGTLLTQAGTNNTNGMGERLAGSAPRLGVKESAEVQ